MNNELILLLSDFLGKPKQIYNNQTQVKFDCPICSAEKNMPEGDGKGNLEVNVEIHRYNCWACSPEENNHGTIRKLIKNFGLKKHTIRYNLFFPEDEIKEKKIVEKQYVQVLPKEYEPLYGANKRILIIKQAYEYLYSRNINDEMIKKFNIGFARSGEYNGRIIIPSYDKNNKVNYFVSRSFVKSFVKYKNPKANKEIIFNEHLLNWDEPIYIVEGPFDHICTPNSFCLLGKSFNEFHLKTIYENAKSDIIIALDPDAHENALNIFNTLNVGLLKDRVYILELEEYDLAELFEKEPEMFFEKIKNYKKPKEIKIW